MAAAAKVLLCSVQTLSPLLDTLERRGVDVGRVLARAGLTREQMGDPELRIPHAQSVAAWESAFALAGDPALGLHVAEGVQAEDLRLFTYLCASSATGREAWERSIRYLRIVHDAIEFDLRVEGDLTVCRTSVRSWTSERWAAEYQVALMVRVSPLVVGDDAEVSAWFQHDAPEYVEEYHRVLGVPVRFGAPCDAIVGPAWQLDRPLPRADSALCALIEEHAKELLARVPQTDGFADAVRQCIAAQLSSGTPSAESVARALGMSARTLRRRLRALDTSHQQLLDEVRCDLAQRALAQQGVSVNEVAFLLGFSDASAFNKAFRRWTGRSPGETVRERRASGRAR